MTNKYLKMVKQDGYALQVVPARLRSAAVYEVAVKQDGRALQFVPDALRTAVERRLKEEAGE
ncbi:MAG: DUF4116 domain-containing protein [Treponema sp.]|jgi:hypothetical protein|nr:DUF4116 domain-containing protein [Treponema sp.]